MIKKVEQYGMISIIIVDYKTIEKTVDFIKQLSMKCFDWNIYSPIIIDNAEDNSSFEWISGRFSKYHFCHLKIEAIDYSVYTFETEYGSVLYCRTGKNCGYAKGNNLGTIVSDYLLKSEYYIICNNDLCLSTPLDFMQFISVFDSDEHIAVIGPKIIDLNGQPQSPRKRVSAFEKLFCFCWLSTWPFRKDVDLDYTNENKKCYWVSGSFLVIKACYFRDCGRFDEGTFLYAEEMILGERLRKIDKYMYFIDDYVIVHEHGGTVKANKISKQSERWSLSSTQYYMKKYRNCPLFIIKLSNINFAIYESLKSIRKRI